MIELEAQITLDVTCAKCGNPLKGKHVRGERQRVNGELQWVECLSVEPCETCMEASRPAAAMSSDAHPYGDGQRPLGFDPQSHE